MQGRKKNEEEKSLALFRREYNPWPLDHTEWALPLCPKLFSLTNWGTIIVSQKNIWPLGCAKIRTHSNRIPKSSKTVFHSWLYGAHLKKPWLQRSLIHHGSNTSKIKQIDDGCPYQYMQKRDSNLDPLSSRAFCHWTTTTAQRNDIQSLYTANTSMGSSVKKNHWSKRKVVFHDTCGSHDKQNGSPTFSRMSSMLFDAEPDP